MAVASGGPMKIGRYRCALVLAQQHDRLVRRDLDSNAHQRQTDHALPP